MTILTAELVARASPHSGVAEVKGGIGGREPHGFQGNLREVHHLQKDTVWMDRVTKGWGTQTRQGILWEVEDQGRQEEALGQRLISLPLKMKRLKMQWHTTHDIGMCLFHCYGWDNCYLLPYVFRSLQLFPGDLVRS